MCVCVCVCVCIHYVCVCVCVFVYTLRIYVCVYVCVCVCVCIHMYMPHVSIIRVCIYVCMCVYIYVYIHTYICVIHSCVDESISSLSRWGGVEYLTYYCSVPNLQLTSRSTADKRPALSRASRASSSAATACFLSASALKLQAYEALSCWCLRP